MKNDIIIKKIVGYIDKIQGYCEGKGYDGFVADTVLVEACVFNLSQIGELVRHFDKEFVETHDDIPWSQIKGLRNRIVHDYEGVNLRLVWEIIDGDIQELKEQLLAI